MADFMATTMTDSKNEACDQSLESTPEVAHVIPQINSTPIDAEFDLAAQELAQVSDIFEEDFLYHIKPDSRRNERIIAFCLVYAADRFEYSVNLVGLMQNLRDGYSLEVANNVFITTLVGGVIEQYK